VSSPPPAFEEPEASSQGVRRVGLVLGPLLFLALLSWTDGPLDELQRKTAAITALTATWWITAALPIGITSILPAALLPLMGVMGGREVAPRYMHDLVFLFLGAFIIALGLERWNVHKRIALWILSLVGSRPRNLVLGFMIASAMLSFWINNTSTTLLMLPIGVAVVVSVTGGRPTTKDPFAVALLLGMAYSASVGGMATPVGTAPNQVFLGQFQDRFPDAPAISFGQWMAAWVPLVILYIPLGWIVLCFVALKVPQGSQCGGDVIQRERTALGRMKRGEKLMAVVFATTASLWVTRSNLELGFLTIPGWARHVLPASIEAPEKFITDATVATFMAVLCFLIPVDRKRGVFLMDWKTAKKMPWEVLLIGGGFAIAGAFQVSGLDGVLGEALSGWMKGRSSWVVVAGIAAFVALLTEVTSNTATTAVLLPVLGQAAVAAGFSPLMTMGPATMPHWLRLSASCSFMART